MYQYSESVLTTRETSYEAAADQCAEALVLTTMLSFFSIDDIYRVLFCADTVVEGAEHTEGDDGTSWRSLVSSQQTVDAYKIEECFAVLQKYALVQWKADQWSYAMHKLVHAWGYDLLSVEELNKYSQVAFELVVGTVEMAKAYGRGPEDNLRRMPRDRQLSSVDWCSRHSRSLHGRPDRQLSRR